MDELSDEYRRGWEAAMLEIERAQWRTIDTAPKEGDDILASHVNPSCVMVVSWDDLPGHPDHPWLSDGDLRYHREAFTHWMPLPPPPATDHARKA